MGEAFVALKGPNLPFIEQVCLHHEASLDTINGVNNIIACPAHYRHLQDSHYTS
jgi:nitrite reductase/ring-hydroxylating ferredoxin subunit